MRITVLYDNERLEKNLGTGWGFSALIDRDVLFDTGGDPSILLENMRSLDVDPQEIEFVVLSHGHGDHTGGLTGLVERNPDVSIYAPPRLPGRLRGNVPDETEVFDSDEPTAIRRGIETTGALGTTKEQGLVCSMEAGGILITGCAHPGLANLLGAASSLEGISGVIGGFHGFSELGRLENLDLIVPCHCTRRKEEIERRYPDKTVKCGAGLVIEDGKVNV